MLKSFPHIDTSKQFLYGCYPSHFIYASATGIQSETGFKDVFGNYFFRCMTVFLLDILGHSFKEYRDSLVLYSNETINWMALEEYVTSIILSLTMFEPRVKNKGNGFHYVLLPKDGTGLKNLTLLGLNKTECHSLMIDDARRFGDKKVNSEFKKLIIKSIVEAITEESCLKQVEIII